MLVDLLFPRVLQLSLRECESSDCNILDWQIPSLSIIILCNMQMVFTIKSTLSALHSIGLFSSYYSK